MKRICAISFVSSEDLGPEAMVKGLTALALCAVAVLGLQNKPANVAGAPMGSKASKPQVLLFLAWLTLRACVTRAGTDCVALGTAG